MSRPAGLSNSSPNPADIRAIQAGMRCARWLRELIDQHKPDVIVVKEICQALHACFTDKVASDAEGPIRVGLRAIDGT
jgi:hypothetical protein